MAKKNKTDQVKTVEPIRDVDQIDRMLSELKEISYRDYMIFLFGINTGLRISDILKLKVGDVKGKDHVWTSSTKTHKPHKVVLNDDLKPELDEYVKNRADDEWLFQSRRKAQGDHDPDKLDTKGRLPVDLHRIYRVFNKAGEKAGITSKIGTHTMRKSYGYHFYKMTKDIAQLQEILQHSAPSVTLKYIGITGEETENAQRSFSYSKLRANKQGDQ